MYSDPNQHQPVLNVKVDNFFLPELSTSSSLLKTDILPTSDVISALNDAYIE